MNKIEKVYSILVKRLPLKYIIPIKIYKNPYTLLSTYCKKEKINYKDTVEYYNEYFKTHKYIETKYSKNHGKNRNKRDVSSMMALATYPISLAKNQLIKQKNSIIAFCILHEIGHFIIGDDEIKADRFAIRWTRKIIKERLIK